MSILHYGAIAALFMGVFMGATLKPSATLAAHAQQAPQLVVDPANDGLLASAVVIARARG